MRSLGFAIIAAASLCASPVLAADMPVKQPPIYTETGAWNTFYMGGHIGYGAGGIEPTFFEDGLGKFSPKGVIWGAQAGKNWQYGNVVGGFEIDVTKLQGKDNLSSLLCEGDCGVAGRFDFVGTVRARIGYANGSWLVYGTGGLALGHSALEAEGVSFGNTLVGWTGGAGIEAKLNKFWSVRAQYLHFDFGKDTFAGVLPVKNTLDTATLGLNFHWGP